MLSGVAMPVRWKTGFGPVSGGGVTAALDALADGAALADGGALGAAEALVVGAVDEGVSPPHAASRATTRTGRTLRMGWLVSESMREIKAPAMVKPMQGTTRTRPLNWFVRGGTVVAPDGGRHAVDVDPVVIGRETGAQLLLADPEVSAVHCELRATEGGILVRDLGSTNGTFVGPLKVQEATITHAASSSRSVRRV